jgi:DNA repair protein RAD16
MKRADQPKDVIINLLPFQLEGLNWLTKQEESRFNGGILADEMGMGKTIQMISLLVSKRDITPTLIICPTVAILQWMQEIKTRTTENTLKVLLFHGKDLLDETMNYVAKFQSPRNLSPYKRKGDYGV